MTPVKTQKKNVFACTKCNNKAIYKNQGQFFCKEHFLNYFETKVFKTIKKYQLFSKNDNICVATSGGKDSLAVLYMTMLYCNKYNIKFFALCIDEGIAEYRKFTVDDLTKFCEKYKIPLHVLSFKDNFGLTLDEMTKKAVKEKNKKPCTVCGILRRKLLNKGARELNATKLVTGHNLDDETQSVLMNQFLGNSQHNASLGPTTGLSINNKFIPRIKPLYLVTEKETRLYCLLRKFEVHFSECPNISLSFRAQVRDKINDIENVLPGAKYGVINSFLEILPLLKQHYKNADNKKNKNFSFCSECGEPCSGEICNACKLEKELV